MSGGRHCSGDLAHPINVYNDILKGYFSYQQTVKAQERLGISTVLIWAVWMTNQTTKKVPFLITGLNHSNIIVIIMIFVKGHQQSQGSQELWINRPSRVFGTVWDKLTQLVRLGNTSDHLLPEQLPHIWAMSWENLLLPYANNKAADQLAHSRSLISTSVVHCLDSIISILAIAEISRL